jgi:uncharacterized protein
VTPASHSSGSGVVRESDVDGGRVVAARGRRRGEGEDVGPVAGATASEWERTVVRAQLGRPPRAMRAVAAWCPCGLPDVVETAPRLANGTPFPTLYYLTCPRAASAIGRLEAGGVMREMSDRLRADDALADRYRAAHEAYLRRRDEIDPVPEIDGVSAGGMPGRVKCLHVLVGHALAAGPGVNPLGDEALDLLPPWWEEGPCVAAGPPEESTVDTEVSGVDGAGQTP